MSTFLMEDVGKTAGGVLLPTVAKALMLPIDTYWSAQRSIGDYTSHQFAWHKNPCVLPSPDTLMDLLVREMGPSRNVVVGALRCHGIDLYAPARRFKAVDDRRLLWHAVEAMKAEVPNATWMLDAWRRGLLGREQAERALIRAGGDWERMTEFADTLRDRPGIAEIIRAHAEGRLDRADATTLIKEAGSDISLWEGPILWQRESPGLAEMLEWRRRGLMDASEMRFYLGRRRLDHSALAGRYERLVQAIPGIADTLRMGVRQLFSPEIVADYGLYDEFPETMRPFFAQLGLDYPTDLNMPARLGGRQLTLPELYWGMTREILPLGSAYLAYQRLRPDRVADFADEVPGIRPFTIDDLRYHMRVAGYPPPMRDFLIALSHPPLGRREIQWGVQFLGWNVAQTKPHFLDLGASQTTAQLQAEIAVARAEAREDAWKASVERRAHISTVSTIEGMYNEGIIDRATALRNLSAAGLSADLSTQLLDLDDATRARGLLREAVRGTGRDFLSGSISAGEAIAALAALGIREQRAGELMQIWSIRKSRHRRQADTGRILRWLGQGRITPQDARRRLTNLDWTDPDTLLLIGEALSNLDKLRAREQKAAESEQTRRAKEIQRLAKEAESEKRRLLAEANRVAPRSVLQTWLKDDVIDETTFRDLLAQRGYPQEDIDRYVQDINAPKPTRPKVVRPASTFPKPEGSAHPALGLVEKMYLTEVISLAQFEEQLKEMGYAPDDRRRIIALADIRRAPGGTA